MVTPEQLQSSMTDRAINTRSDDSGAIQVAMEDLNRAVQLFDELGLVVLGLDGLKQDGAVIVPLVDFIADFGAVSGEWPDRVRASAASACAVAAEWQGGPDWVEITVDGLDQ